jgi:hypothetical protein
VELSARQSASREALLALALAVLALATLLSPVAQALVSSNHRPIGMWYGAEPWWIAAPWSASGICAAGALVAGGRADRQRMSMGTPPVLERVAMGLAVLVLAVQGCAILLLMCPFPNLC